VEKRRNALFEHYFENLICEGRMSGFVRKNVLAKVVVKMVLSAVRSILNPTKLDELHILPKGPAFRDCCSDHGRRCCETL
jgi:hypothetical protein